MELCGKPASSCRAKSRLSSAGYPGIAFALEVHLALGLRRGLRYTTASRNRCSDRGVHIVPERAKITHGQLFELRVIHGKHPLALRFARLLRNAVSRRSDISMPCGGVFHWQTNAS